MSFLKMVWLGIRNFFLGNGARHEGEASFPEINPDRIKADLKVVETARAHGAKGVPDFRDTRLTETEHQIQGTVGKLRAATFKTGERWLKQIQSRLDAIDLTKDFDHTVQLGDEFGRKADSILSSANGELQESIRISKSHETILERFREANQLPDTPAELPGPLDHGKKICLLIIFCAAESFINANFFASGLVGGLISGLLMALTLAVLNLALPFFVGRVFTNKNHVNGLRRALGWLCFGIGVAWTCSIGVSMAYLRHVMPLIDDEATNQIQFAIDSFLLGESPFTDINSIALCAITVFFGLVALHHGYRWMDRYPGYSKIYGAYVEANQNKFGVIANLRAALEEEKEKTLSQIDANVKNATEAVRYFKYSMGEKSVAKKKVTEHLILADKTIEALIEAYRYENQMARPSDKPRPDYFNNPIALEPQDLPDFGLERDEARLEIQEKMLSEMLGILQPTRAKVQSSFVQKFDQLKPLESRL